MLTTASKQALALIGIMGIGGIAAFNGVFIRSPEPPAVETAQPVSVAPNAGEPSPVLPETAPEAEVLVDPPKEADVPIEPEAAEEPQPVEDQTAEEPVLIIPSFALLRVEPDGSVVVVGQAAPDSEVELFSGTRKLGETKAAANGDFVIVMEEPLAPGDYELVLRARGTDNRSATSTETAVVSIPETADGQVLALVQQPGQPSRLISVPDEAAPQLVEVETRVRDQFAVAIPEPDFALDTATAPELSGSTTEAPAPQEPNVAVVEPVAPQAETVSERPAADIRIVAVEIDGDSVFVAGEGTPGRKVRVYASDMLLGETTINPGGTFLVDVRRDLAVGDYIIRADVIDPQTGSVTVRASVPFTRSEGERVAAVAVPQSLALPDAAPSVPFEPVSPSGASGVDVPQSLGVLTGPPPIAAVDADVDPSLVATEESVIIRRGDTLWQISRRVYGKGVKYTTIYAANEDQISDPNRIWPGQIFTVPGQGDADSVALEKHGIIRQQN